MSSSLPDRLEIHPCGPLDASLRVPGSKSLTNRVLLVAALAEGRTRIRGALESDDTQAMREALGALGVAVRAEGDRWEVEGTGGRLQAPAHPLDARGSGTTARFLTAAAVLATGPVCVDGNQRLRERPIGELVAALRRLGGRAEYLGRAGYPPVRVQGGAFVGGETEIDASRSSQFVSALLMIAPYAERDVALHLVHGLASRPYVELTLAVMQDFGAEARWEGAHSLRVRAGRLYRARDVAIEPDASAAVYPLAAAAIAGGRVRVLGLGAESKQADLRLLELLERMGCQVRRDPNAIEVRRGDRPLRGIEADLSELPDATLALAVVALFATGPTRLRGLATLRLKESDRLAVLERELARLGARTRRGPDWLEIEPAALHGAEIETYDDHRVAMAFALAGLRVPGVVIRDPGCVRKTWPDYFQALERLTGGAVSGRRR